MQFKVTDSRPCYLSEDKRRRQKLDINLGKQHTNSKTGGQLILILKSVGVVESKGNRETLMKYSTVEIVDYPLSIPKIRSRKD